MRTIELPPYAPTLIESTRAIGYSLDAAIADIIDNSIAACSKNIDIFFFPVGDAYIAVLDNGNGMNAAEIDVAMQYGSRNPLDARASNDLGRFGLGLKTASLSQCRILTVISKKRRQY
ncbi:MAG TPA: ATP-binding protein [Ruminococcus flavefaciens]|nr:ATP-binding protein [Ruminococcus flavefaciens]HQM01828.1 ATP-binding protein [Ruminococcus flavefaciens]